MISSTIESEVRSYSRNWPVVFDHGRGSRVSTRDGRVYLDFFAGASALNYGHNHPVLKRALLDYLEQDRVTHSLEMLTAAKEDFLTEFAARVLGPRRRRQLSEPAPASGRGPVHADTATGAPVAGPATVNRSAPDASTPTVFRVPQRRPPHAWR